MEVQNNKQFYSVAFVAGVVGAVVMSIIMALARGMELTQLNIEMMLGSMITAEVTGGAVFLGFIWHLINGGVFALIYAAGFKALGRTNTLLSLGFATIHWVVAGIFMGVIPTMHPLIPETLLAPGFFGVNGGVFDFGALLMLHWVYGGIVGYICQKTAGVSAFLREEHERKVRNKPQRDFRGAA